MSKFGLNQPIQNFPGSICGWASACRQTTRGRKLHAVKDLRGHSFAFPGSSKKNVNGQLYHDKGPPRHGAFPWHVYTEDAPPRT